MALNFPNSPTNGQAFVDPTGQQWTYETATNSWTAEGAPAAGMVYKGPLNVTAAPPTGARAGWMYTVTIGGTVNAGFNGLTGNIPAGTTIIYDGTNWQQAGAGVLWTRIGTELRPQNAGDLVARTVLPAASTSAQGAVQMADAAAITAGTAGRVVDAAQLKAQVYSKTETYSKTEANTKFVDVAGDTMTGNLVLPTVNGGVPDRLNRAGNILQVVIGKETAIVTQGDTHYQQVAALRATITPTSATSKILVMLHLAGCGKNGNLSMYIRLMRDTTKLIDVERSGGDTASAARNFFGSISTCYLDSPNTTSAVTYHPEVAVSATSVGNGGYINAPDGGINPTSTITLLEVAG